MQKHLSTCLLALGLMATPKARGADSVRRLIIEGDAVAPTSAAYESHHDDKIKTSKYGVIADFNVGSRLSTGPEFWNGTFSASGPKDPAQATERDNLLPGERHKIEASRLRWMIGLWEQAQSMRGWYIKGGYSYTKIQSRANRYSSIAAASTAAGADDLRETDIVTDTRHGIAVAFGNRWLFWNQSFALTLGASFTQNFTRDVTVDSNHPNARKEYDQMIERLPDTKIATRPIPELNIHVGYAF